jgi:hypothetical protein
MTCANNAKKAAPATTGTACANGGEHTGCACGKQQFPMTRKEFFAAAALQGMISQCPDGPAVFRLCVQCSSATANTAFFIAQEMEVYAMRNDPPRRKRKGGAK